MKKLSPIFNFILFFQFSLFAQSGWNNVAPSDTLPGILGIYALSSQNVWVVGQEGTILNTTNSGIVWNEINSPVAYSLYNVHFINADTGWIGGDNGTITEIIRTTNRGSSWELKTLAASDYGNYDIEFTDGGTGDPPRGFVTAGRSLVWRTDDYGNNWGTTGIDGGCGAGDLQSICFIDKNEGWFVGTPALGSEVTIVHTTDGGQTYDIQTNPTDPDIKLNCVSFATDQQGIAVGLAGTILYTSDGGQNWEIRPYNSDSWTSVSLNQSGKAWAVGYTGNIAYSTDWGYTWTAQQSGVTCVLWEVFFVNDDEGWIVGGGIGQPGVILHTTSGGVVTGIDDNKIVKEFMLFQNYPNPFNPATKIKYSIPHRSLVTLKVLDILGKEIITLINEDKSAGTYELTWNAANLPSGVYFYKIKAGNYVSVKKMILIK